MKHARDITGPATVGHMAEMTGLKGMVITCLRQWNRGGAAAALAVLRDRMGETRAAAAFEALQDVADSLDAHMRRPLRCHAPHCHCVGADEAAFARFVEESALGGREDALMLASLLVEARGILPLTEAAARLGLCLHRAVLYESAQRMPDPVSRTRH
ncbi:hypothetical protein [Roseovarius sp. D22-M7]|uniref:hypothetical protein n=1 Tax=Roseovarius sp. D22-M7 TaxID=3127116 RepID=UPI00300F7C3D